MSFLKRFMKREIAAFRMLDTRAKILLASFNINEVTSPIFGIFTNAYLFREYASFTPAILYNIGMFIGGVTGAILNGVLLRKRSSAQLYFLGTLLQATALFCVVIVGLGSLSEIFAVGILSGIGVGIYYGNRNFLTLSASSDEKRDYFIGLELSSAKVIGIVAPVLIGWFIAFGSVSRWYDIALAYRWLVILAFALQLLSGWIVMRRSFQTPEVRPLFLRDPDPQWKKMRLFLFLTGLFDGLNWYVPTLLILTLIGNEGDLGTLQSLGMLITAIILYWIGRKTIQKDRASILVAGVACICLGAAALALSYSWMGAVVSTLTIALGMSLFSQTWATLLYAAVDGKTKGDKRYAKLLDHEIFLNSGRIIGSLFFLSALLVLGEKVSLQYVQLFVGIALIGTIPLARMLSVDRTDMTKQAL